LIVAGRVVLDADADDGWLEMAHGRIVASGLGSPPREADLWARWVAPGLVDLQVNGGVGVEVTGGRDALSRIDSALLAVGVTSYLATIITTDDATARATVEAVAKHRRNGTSPLAGVHLEGPFLSPHQPGVHRLSLLRTPGDGVPEHVFHPEVRLVTLAPELPGAIALIRRLAGRGVLVSIGHSAATAEEARAAVQEGASMVTHLFNAMPPFHHRAPGLAGWALGHANVALGLIADGAHVHPDALRVVLRAAAERVVVVSDASVAALAPPGLYRQAGVDIERHADGRVTTAEGGLAGSGISVADAVRLLHLEVGVAPAQALRAASWRPAALLGRTALLAPGADADLVLLDETLQVRHVIFRGKRVGP
jgi:N-acetylglucosamine-6-phosphate deacetylase